MSTFQFLYDFHDEFGKMQSFKAGSSVKVNGVAKGRQYFWDREEARPGGGTGALCLVEFTPVSGSFDATQTKTVLQPSDFDTESGAAVLAALEQEVASLSLLYRKENAIAEELAQTPSINSFIETL